MSDLLTEDEIYERLTKPIRQHAAQVRVLSRLFNCPIQRRPDGAPIVPRSLLNRLEARQAQNDAGINWSRQA
jgi:hypothetical protein